MNNELMFSSKSDQHATPQDFFDSLNAHYNFNLDVCALPENAKCEKYFTPEIDGLKQDWKGICWMNPPYGEPEYTCKPNCIKKICEKRGYHNDEYVPGVIDWVEKAYLESRKQGCVVVGLLPARTDTKWFHNFIYNKAEINFVKGRLKFGDAKNSAPFPSMVVVWR